MTDSTPTPPPTARRPQRSRLLPRLLAGLIIVVLLCAGLLFYVLRFDSGTALLWKTATSLSQGSLQGTYVKGNLSQGLSLRDIRYHDATTDVRIDAIDSNWDLGLFGRYLHVAYLRVGDVDVTLQPSPPTESSDLPDDLTIPFSLALDNITLDKLRIDSDGSVTELGKLALHGSSDKRQHALTVERLQTPFGQFETALKLDGKKPFAIDGKASLEGTYQNEPYRVATQLSGALEDLHVALQATGDKLHGTATVDATPFAAIPLKQAIIDIKQLNPHMFGDTLPVADIAISAKLLPDNASDDTRAPLRVAGHVSVTNTMPGALDQQRLPLISAKTDVQLSAAAQSLDKLDIRLVKQASIKGSGRFYPAATAEHAQGGTFSLDVDNLDMQALHQALQPSRLKGPVTVSLTDKEQAVTVALKDKVFDIQLKAQMSDNIVTLETVRLAANKAVLAVRGGLQTTDDMPYHFEGTLRDFDPGFWIKGGNKVKAALNMDFDTKGTASPVNDVVVNYHMLANSHYDGMPTTGRGTVHVVGAQLRPSKAFLSIAGNDVSIDGSFGRKGDNLKVTIDAPRLDRLGFGMNGIVKVDGHVKGTTSALTVNARYDVDRLHMGDITLDKLTGHTDLQADLDQGLASAANKISSVIKVQNLRSPYMNLAHLDMDLAGTSARHTLAVTSNGEVSGKPLRFSMDAQGKIFASKDSYGWDGVINKLENTATPNGLPRISLASPLRIRAAAGDISLGATQLLLADATMDIKQLHYQNGKIRAEGAVNALNLATIQTLLKDLAGVSLPVKTNLVLDSAWNFSLAETASGYIQVARRQGDISVASGSAYVPLNLTDLKWRVDFKQSQLLLDAITAAQKVGTITARGTTSLVKQNGIVTLSPDSRLAGQASLNLPDLTGVGNLIGPHVSLRGKLDTTLNVEGTVGKPKLSGGINGDNISFTLLDEGIKLHNGTIRAVLERNVLTLNQVEFFGGQGTLRASGQVKLDESNAAMQAQVVADKLQIFASPDRQLMLSGRATLANVDQRLRLDGSIVVDKGQFDLPKDSAPKLGSDVVILDPDKPDVQFGNDGKPDNVSPIINISVNLGNNFRFKGSGADLALTGDLAIKSDQTSELHSSGTLEARGTYEAFGVKLNIERGLINFHGPLTNPGLNIVAMRRNQEVEAGVEVTGSANLPRVRLISEPNVSDEEKLSWLMFGQGSSSSSMSEAKATNQALALVGNFGGKKIAQEFGFDQFAIGSSESGLSSDQVVNIGKAITRKIMFGMEKALTNPDSVAKLTWNMSRRWSLVARAGTINGINILFNRRFD